MKTVRAPAQFTASDRGGAACFSQMDLSTPPEGEEVTLDLSDVTFIDPIGLTSLWAWKCEALRVAKQFTVERPRNPDVQKYLEVMGFYDSAPRPTDIQVNLPDSELYLPIHQLHPGPGNAERLASNLASAFGSGDPGTINLLAYCFGEAIDNVFSHANSPVGAVASAQMLPRTSHRWCQASIADRGIGVLDSLRGSRKHGDLALHEDALRRAIQDRVTCTDPYEGMYGTSRSGVGLYMISETCRLTGGELILMSGDSVLRVESRGERVEPVPTWPGTILTVRIAGTSVEAGRDILQEIRSRRKPLSEGLARFEE